MSPKDNAGLYTNAGELMWAWGTGEWNHLRAMALSVVLS
jgi:hypothetical protein